MALSRSTFNYFFPPPPPASSQRRLFCGAKGTWAERWDRKSNAIPLPRSNWCAKYSEGVTRRRWITVFGTKTNVAPIRRSRQESSRSSPEKAVNDSLKTNPSRSRHASSQERLYIMLPAFPTHHVVSTCSVPGNPRRRRFARRSESVSWNDPPAPAASYRSSARTRHSSQFGGGMQSSSVKAIRSPRDRRIPSLRAQLGPRRSLSMTMMTSSGTRVWPARASRQNVMVSRPIVGTTTETICRSFPMAWMFRNRRAPGIQDALVLGDVPVCHGGPAEVLLHPFPCLLPQLPAMLRVVHQEGQCLPYGGSISRIHQQRGVSDDLGATCPFGGDDRHARRHGLQQDDGEVFRL